MPHEPVDLGAVRGLDRVEVGQVEQHQARRARRRRARAASGRRASRAGAESTSLPTAAVVVDVVGRRTPARDELAAGEQR